MLTMYIDDVIKDAFINNNSRLNFINSMEITMKEFFYRENLGLWIGGISYSNDGQKRYECIAMYQLLFAILNKMKKYNPFMVELLLVRLETLRFADIIILNNIELKIMEE